VTPEPVRQPEQASGVLVTAGARKLCRAVGTTAWAVLCDVTLDAEADPEGRLAAATNVRRIADHLGISKDTAARALARLNDAGLVGRHRARSESGRFTTPTYVVRLGTSEIILLSGRSCPEDPCPVAADTDAARGNGDTSPSVTRRSSRPASSRRRRTPAEQASLFPPAGQPEDAR
jgi:DNA-binding transcriptional MocR family regulator